MGKKTKIEGQIAQRSNLYKEESCTEHVRDTCHYYQNKGTSALQTPFCKKSLGLNNGEKQNQFKVVIKKHSLKRKKEEENLVSSLETCAEYLPHSTCRYGFPGWLKGKTK